MLPMVVMQHRILSQKKELDKETQFRYISTVAFYTAFSSIQTILTLKDYSFLFILSYYLQFSRSEMSATEVIKMFDTFSLVSFFQNQ